MNVVGYADRLSVQPGETIKFMVSCKLPSYRADVVHLIHGDTNPEGPGFKERLIRTTVSREYAGREQAINNGSYILVPDNPLLNQTASITLQGWVYPTTLDKGTQAIITKWSADDGMGYGLFVEDDGSLALWLGNESGQVDKLRTGTPMHGGRWYFVAGVYDAERQRVLLYQEPVVSWPRDGSNAVVEQPTPISGLGSTEVPLFIAGYSCAENPRKALVQGHFNGKIDNPRLFGQALSPQEVLSLRRDAPPFELGEKVVAAWDFRRDFSTDKATDSSPNGLHGKVVNMPARAMTGHNWKGTEVAYNSAPDEYGAIYFHDDDLEDAGWEIDFEFVVPEHMKSGVYAARLRTGNGEGDSNEDHVPFFVRPKSGTATAPIVFLVPTASYLAYANSHSWSHPHTRARLLRIMGIELEYPVRPQDKYVVENRLHSLYDRHTDNSGVAYSSYLRPILNMRPRAVSPTLALGKGAPHQFGADLHLLDWMEAKGYEFDVLTDEDLHLEGAGLLAPYNVVLTGSHPEYWSGQMLDGMETYLSGGGRLMYLGGNGFYWITSFAPGRSHVVEIRRWRGTEIWEADPGEFHHSTSGELGGLWRFRGRAPQKLTGVGFSAQGFDVSLPYHRKPGSYDPRSAFIFEGVDKDEVIGDFGLVMGGAGGFEVDRADITLGTPPHTLVLATTTGFSDVYQHVIEEVLMSDSMQGGSINPLVKGDMVYFEGPKGGGVFSVGSIAWCGSLSHNDYANNVSRITENVLRRFAMDEPLP
jgi:N,N-dimethylformamidase